MNEHVVLGPIMEANWGQAVVVAVVEHLQSLGSWELPGLLETAFYIGILCPSHPKLHQLSWDPFIARCRFSKRLCTRTLKSLPHIN